MAKMHVLCEKFKFIFASMFRLSFLFLGLLISSSVSGQLKNLYSNIRSDLKGDRSAFVSLDGKNSIVRDVPIKLFGLQVGYLYNKRTNIFVGFYRSYNKEAIIYNPTIQSPKTDTNTIFQAYKLTYFNLGCEYYFHNSNRWRFSLPFSIGIGGGKITQRKEKISLSKKSSFVMPLELGFFANYKLTWWMWLGAGMGTRVSLTSSNFTGSYYTFGLSFRYGEIYDRSKKMVKAHKKSHN